MLRVMRKNAKSWAIKIAFALIIVVFIFWGFGGFGDQGLARVAVVNGRPIHADSLEEAYNALLEQNRRRFPNMDDAFLKSLNLREQALDQLINRTLMLQEAKRLNLHVTDTELKAAIVGYPPFQVEGVFNTNRYRRVLAANRLTPERFEEMQRESLLISKLTDFITDSVKTSEVEVRKWYDYNNTALTIDYVLFTNDRYSDINPLPEAVQAHYEENKENYKSDLKRTAMYVTFVADDFMPKVEVDEAEIRYYYEDHKDEYETEKTVKARHILFNVPENAEEALVDQKRAEAESVLAKVREGEDFAQLAKDFSEGPSGEKGGDLGYFAFGDMVKPFSETAFSMEPGEVSEPVRTKFGWHIIQVEDVKPEGVKPMESVKPEIEETIKKRIAREMALDASEAFLDAFLDGIPMKTVAANQGVDIQTTEPFTRSGPVKLGKDRYQFASVAFEIPLEDLSDPKDMDSGIYLIRPLEEFPPEIQPFEEVKEKVRKNLVEKLRAEKSTAEAEVFLAEWRVETKTEAIQKPPAATETEPPGEDPKNRASRENPDVALTNETKQTETTPAAEETEKPEESPEDTSPASLAAAERGLDVKTSKPFKRKGAIPDLGYEPEVISTAFTLSEENPFPEAPVKGKKGVYVIRFVEKTTPDRETFEKEEDSVRQTLISRKRSTAFEAWIQRLREKGEIEIAARAT